MQARGKQRADCQRLRGPPGDQRGESDAGLQAGEGHAFLGRGNHNFRFLSETETVTAHSKITASVLLLLSSE